MSKKRDMFKLPAGPAEICFDKNEFMKKTFSVDEFLQDHRNAATLETMRDDLGLYLKVLRSAMIELINEDYADFVNLSSNLVGLDQSILGIQTPLNGLKDEISSVRTTLESTMHEVNECLEHKQQLREHLKSVQCLSTARKSMAKLDKLLSEQLNDDNTLNPMLLERAAMELVKLKYNLQFCHQHFSRLDKNTNGFDQFDEVHNKLLAKVEKHFLRVLDDKKIDQLERCLRVYCTLGEYQAAEEIFRLKVVGPHMHPIISEVALQNAPQGLNGIYNQIIQFLNERMRQLLQLTQRNDAGTATVQGFDFIINSFWVEVEKRIENHMASIFAPGNPESFYQRFGSTVGFLEKIENVIKSRQQIDAFHGHEQYKQFQSKWNLPVYFQIRFQEIGGALESVCSEPIRESTFSVSSAENSFSMKPFIKGDVFIKRCWSNGVYLPQLFVRFFKFTLQILSRLGKWSEEAVGTKSLPSTVDRVDFLTLIYLDVNKLIEKIPGIIDCITEKIPANLNTQLDLVEKCLDESRKVLIERRKFIEKQWSNEIIAQTAGWTKQVADIPRLYRKTNRDAPKQPCNYVEQILKPNKSFYKKNSNKIAPDVIKQCMILSFSHLNRQYHSAVKDVLTSVQKTEESLRRLKNLREKSGTAQQGSTSTTGMSDDDKIRLQLHVDICAWCDEIEKLGIERNAIDQLTDLIQLVEESTKIKVMGK